MSEGRLETWASQIAHTQHAHIFPATAIIAIVFLKMKTNCDEEEEGENQGRRTTETVKSYIW